MAMKILLWCDDLVIRLKLEAVWKSAGATMLKKTSQETPDCIVVDLGGRHALRNITHLRTTHPQVDVIAFAQEYDEELFAAAEQAGASDFAARGSIVERVTRRIPVADARRG
jgi:DNA-binding NarL/FixJ family response regulator